MSIPLRLLVVTVVHHPLDARIHRRQITALRDAGHLVTYAAPWSHCGVNPDSDIVALDLPRASGRQRLRSFRAAKQLIRREGRRHDLVLLHDPELVLAARLSRVRCPVVWDVHEDTVAGLLDRRWLPGPVRGLAARSVRSLESMAERRYNLLLAEDAYAERFERSHPIVRNLPPVPIDCPPPAKQGRVVYVGRISRRRGAIEMLRLGPLLRVEGLTLHLVGMVDEDLRTEVAEAHHRGDLVHHGFLENRDALRIVDGALAGLSLLHDVPNYRISAPTKVYEYLSRGVPTITSPLPIPAALVREAEVGIVVEPTDLDEMVSYVVAMAADHHRREILGRRAHDVALRQLNWSIESERFVRTLETWAHDVR